ncbi:MAG: DegT/DnrJ/EryC1/StrS family aminotransferase [Candidatus Nitrosotenuis sp.]
MIKLFDPHFDKAEKQAMINVLESGMWASGAGKGKVLEFENEFNEYIGSEQCVALNSGTAALHLSLLQYDIKDKEVLVPSLTFVSTVHAILYAGGKPVFVDINEDTLCLDAADLKKKISKKTVLVIPVHFGGMPCDLDEIGKIAQEHNLIVVEDAAHACGASYKKKKIGTHSEMVCFSFHPVKNLSMPGGGAIALNGKASENRKNLINSLRWCGIDNRKGIFYDVLRLGWNYYMNEFSAAIGIQQLKKLDKMNNKRKSIARSYHNKISLEHKTSFSEDCCYHLYWVRVKNRSDFISYMNKVGIEVGLHYKPVHLMQMYNSYGSLPITEKIWPELVSIPMHVNLTDDEIRYIIEKINEFIGKM